MYTKGLYCVSEEKYSHGMLCLLRNIFAHILGRFLQHVHARRKESLSFSHYSFNNRTVGEREVILGTPYTKSLLCKKSETLGFFDFSFGHSRFHTSVPVSETRFTFRGSPVLVAKGMTWKKKGWSYIGPLFRSSGTAGWIFMEFRFKSLLKIIAQLSPVKYATRRYPAAAKWLYWGNRKKSYGPTTVISLSSGYPFLSPSVTPAFLYAYVGTDDEWQPINQRFRMVNISIGAGGRRRTHSQEVARPRVPLFVIILRTYFRDINIAMVTISVNAWMTGG
jgi:hypothetical protein